MHVGGGELPDIVEPPTNNLPRADPVTEVAATGEVIETVGKAVIRAFNESESKMIADRISSTRKCTYRGRGIGLQVPWAIPTYQSMLVISLFSGIGTSSMALFLLGAQFIAVHVECEEDARTCSHRSFPHAVHIRYAQQVRGYLFSAVLERRNFCAVIVGGGSPCQPNSWLNKSRKGIGDPRCHLAHHVSRVAAEIQALPAARNIPVYKWLENVGSSPKEVVQMYNESMGCEPIQCEAARFGYTRRNRLLWLKGPSGSVAQHLRHIKLPPGASLVQGQRYIELHWQGKPIPKSVHLKRGYSLAFDPQGVVDDSGRGAAFTFTRCFEHPTDATQGVSKAAIKRFEAAGKPFPPGAFESNSMLHTSGHMRVPDPDEKCAMMGIPDDMVALPAQTMHTPASIRASQGRSASLVGNTLHMPTIMLAMIILLQMPQPTCGRLWTMACDEEHKLQQNTWGTVWWPGVLETWPGILSPRDVVTDMQDMFAPLPVGDFDWHSLELRLATCNIAWLQVYWADASSRGLDPLQQGPQWSMQQHNAATCAGLGVQRRTGVSPKGMPPILPPGMGKAHHSAAALALGSPFDLSQVVDDDIDFSLRTMAVFGPYLHVWIDRQTFALSSCQTALAPLEQWLDLHKPAHVLQVARAKKPGMMAFSSSIMRWPDRAQPCKYVLGFGVAGDIETSHIFRQLPEPQRPDPRDQLLGDNAKAYIAEIMTGRPPKRHADILKESLKEVQKGFATGIKSKEELDQEYGEGGWRPTPRHLVSQENKDRTIDDGLRSSVNKFTDLHETIFTPSIDFIPAVIRRFIVLVLFYQSGITYPVDRATAIRLLPEWCVILICIADLIDAYRQVPIALRDLCLNIVALWIENGGWMFLQMIGSLFGFASSVVNFCRLPALCVAMSIRMMTIPTCSFFDDNASLCIAEVAAVALGAQQLAYDSVGAQFAPDKCLPFGPARVFIGLAVSTSWVSDGDLPIAPKPGLRQKIDSELAVVELRQELGPGRASKLKGQLGWSASSTAGRWGRLGLRILSERQYSESSDTSLDARMVRMFLFIRLMLRVAPPRAVPVTGRNSSPAILYSDASYSPSEARLGWVVFFPDRHRKPEGVTVKVSDATLHSMNVRATQVFPCEALAVTHALLTYERELAGADILSFVDNEAACAAFIKGSSSSTDVDHLVSVAHLVACRANIRVWYEWVDSDSNISDGLSRQGLEDPFAISQGWQLNELEDVGHMILSKQLKDFII